MKGVTTLADIRDRCRIDDETGCWVWASACSVGGGKSSLPVCWSVTHGKVMSVPRLVWGLCRSKPKQMVWRKCMNDLCVNPKHLMSGSRAQWGAWVSERGHLKGNIAKAAMNRALRMRRGTSLTPELAAWARESSQTGVEAAHGLMCSEQALSRARRGETWAPLAPAASVFLIGQAVNASNLRRTA